MISLFIRSYPKDFEWLSYSIKSMHKNLTGVYERILVVPEESDIPNNFKLFFDNIFFTKETHTGYVAQQIDKIRAYKYCSCDNILFSDSDCIYYNPFNASSMLDNGKIVLYKTNYNNLTGDVLVWKDITSKAVGITPEWEYMRQFPIIHSRNVCRYVDELSEYNAYIDSLQSNELSEFNILGVIAETYFQDLYSFVDTSVTLPTIKAKQYWSWGGITEDIKLELEKL